MTVLHAPWWIVHDKGRKEGRGGFWRGSKRRDVLNCCLLCHFSLHPSSIAHPKATVLNLFPPHPSPAAGARLFIVPPLHGKKRGLEDRRRGAIENCAQDNTNISIMCEGAGFVYAMSISKHQKKNLSNCHIMTPLPSINNGFQWNILTILIVKAHVQRGLGGRIVCVSPAWMRTLININSQ